MYSPTLGRFVTKDPIGFQAGDVNLYRFVENDPTNATDPSGLQKGIRGNARALLEAALIATYPDGQEALRRATGSWADEARDYSEVVKNRYPNPKATPEQRRGIQNATRHLYWMMLLTARYGEGLAEEIGNLHEFGENSVDSLIDQYHNAVAREVAPKIYPKLLKTVEPIISQYQFLNNVPGSNYGQILSTLMEAAWAKEEEDTKKEIKKIIDKLVEDSVKDPFKGRLIIDPSDPRIKNIPGWKKDLPQEHRGWWDSTKSK
jgi:hypothetical protein